MELPSDSQRGMDVSRKRPVSAPSCAARPTTQALTDDGHACAPSPAG